MFIFLVSVKKRQKKKRQKEEKKENEVTVFLKQPIAVVVQRLIKINVCMSTLTILANKLLELELGAYHWQQ